jgi:NTE family protein
MTGKIHGMAALGVKRLAIGLAFAMTFAIVLDAVAQPAQVEQPPKPAAAGNRPKVCVVLSGGGARGAAHIGVLKVLEEYRVPIDCIVGTSMGALVGAAYATGMSIPEMETITDSISTELLFKEEPPRQEQSIRRKQDDLTILSSPEIGVGKGKMTFGKGLVSGVQLETVLRRLTKVRGFHRFDELPIPFRAVATDLVTGRPVVFQEGEIANVMRASMSVPGAIAPAEFDGMMLVDGMLTSNLPIETARAMGADIVIAVNVGTPLLKREELSGIVGVAAQMLNILTEQNVRASLALLKPTDILISPELGDFTTADFDSLPQIAPLGEGATRKAADRLALLAVPPQQYAQVRQRQQVDVPSDVQAVDEIRFDTLRRVNPEFALSLMETKAGEPIDQAKLDADMLRLYGTGDFEHVKYRTIEEPGKRVLAVDATEKSWGPDYLRFGLGLSSDFKGDAYFDLLASYRATWLNSLGAEWKTDVQVGHTSGVITEFYQPLNAKGIFFVAPHAGIVRRSIDLYQSDQRIATYDVFYQRAGADLGLSFRRYGEFRLGVEGGTIRPTLSTGPANLTPGDEKIRQGAFTSRLIFDQIDSVHFPRSGARGVLNVYTSSSALGADRPYTKWALDGAGAYSFGDHTFSVGLNLGGKLGADPLPPYDQFQWGGFLHMSGYATGQFVSESLKFGRLMYYHRILRGSLFEGAYGGFSLEIGKFGNPLVPGNAVGPLKSASVFVSADTIIGPAYLGYGRATDGNESFYFYLGREY